MTTSTVTPKSVRPHVVIAEIEDESGYRYWTKPTANALEMNSWLFKALKHGELSDYCCANECWCWEDFKF